MAPLWAGTHTLEVQVKDDTELVRNDPENALGDSVTWTLEVATAATVSARLLNICTRAEVLTGDNVIIGGFTNTGTWPRRLPAGHWDLRFRRCV